MTDLKFSLNNGVFLHFGKIKYSTNIALKDTMEYDALLDTGASVSCMSVDIASVLFRIERNALIKKISPYKCKRKTYDYSNNEITGYNIVAKEVSLCGVRLENLYLRLLDNKSSRIVIGSDFIRAFKSIDMEKDGCVLRGFNSGKYLMNVCISRGGGNSKLLIY